MTGHKKKTDFIMAKKNIDIDGCLEKEKPKPDKS